MIIRIVTFRLDGIGEEQYQHHAALGKLVVRLPTLRLDGPTERLQAPFLWGRRVLPVAWD